MTLMVPDKTLPIEPGGIHVTGRSAEGTPLGMIYAKDAGCQIDNALSSVTEKLSDPSLVLTILPTGIVADRLGKKRENVTIPVEGTAGRRPNPKSNIHESRSEPMEVDARVV